MKTAIYLNLNCLDNSITLRQFQLVCKVNDNENNQEGKDIMPSHIVSSNKLIAGPPTIQLKQIFPAISVD